jgi:hypothetical protein
MGSLGNLYISQSFQSLIHLSTNSSASVTSTELQDGVGTGIGIFVNTAGALSASSYSGSVNGIGNVSEFSTSVNSRILAITSSGGIPAGTVSSSAQITALGFATTSSVTLLSQSLYFTDTTQSANITTNSASAWGAFQSASAYSASAYQVDATQSANITSNSSSIGLLQTFSGSQYKADSSSFNSRILAITSSGGVPAGTVSSSNQITAFGFATTGSNTFIGTNTFEQSVNIKSGSTLFMYTYFNDFANVIAVQNTSGSLEVIKVGGENKVNLQNLSLLVSGAITASGDISSSGNVYGNNINSLIAATGSYITSAQTSSMSVATASVALAISTSISTQNLQHFVTFVDNSTGKQTVQVDGGLKYNPNLDLLLVTNITSSGYISASAIFVNGQSVATSQSVTDLSASVYQTDVTQSYQITANALTASNALTNYSSSQSTLNNTLSSSIATVSSSVGILTSSYNATSSSLNSVSSSLLAVSGAFVITSASLNTVSASAFAVSGAFVITSASLNTVSASAFAVSGTVYTNTNNIIGLNAKTASYATTGSNSLTGSQIITGSLTITGSVATLPVAVTITSNTASIDFSKGSIYTLTLVSSSVATYITASNLTPGQTANLLVTQASALSGSIVWASAFKFPTGSAYTGSKVVNAVDLISFITVNNTTIYSVGAQNLV